MKTALKPVPRQKIKLNAEMKSFFSLLSMDSGKMEELIQSTLEGNPCCEYVRNEYIPSAGEITDIEDHKPSVYEVFMSQLQYSGLDYAPRAAAVILQNLDAAGRLTTSEKEIARISDCSLKDVKRTRCTLLELEPKGIGALTLEECLFAQINKDSDLKKLIQCHLGDIADGALEKIAKERNWAIKYVESLCDELRQLDPCPGYQFDTNQVQYLKPDLELIEEEGELKLVPIRYFHIATTTYDGRAISESERSRFAQYRNEARELQARIRAREETIMVIADILIKTQKQYILEQQPLQRISMTEIAKKCSLSVSTVSRAIKDKSYLFNGNVYLLSSLLCRSVNGTSKEEVKDRIRKLRKEKGDLSDRRISELLLEEGITVSRRTVAKYRNEMHLQEKLD